MIYLTHKKEMQQKHNFLSALKYLQAFYLLYKFSDENFYFPGCIFIFILYKYSQKSIWDLLFIFTIEVF